MINGNDSLRKRDTSGSGVVSDGQIMRETKIYIPEGVYGKLCQSIHNASSPQKHGFFSRCTFMRAYEYPASTNIFDLSLGCPLQIHEM